MLMQAIHSKPLKNRFRLYTLGTCLLLGSYISVIQAEEKTFFRIENEAGRVQLKSTITPAEAKKGYAIVTVDGRIIEEVQPELTPEAFEKLSDELKQKAANEKRKHAEREYNISLLLRYSTLDDLESERKRKLSEFDTRISILRSNLIGLKETLGTQQEKAANIERSGYAVPDSLNQNLKDLETELNEAEAAIKSRQNEKQLVDEQYDADAKRLSSLIKHR